MTKGISIDLKSCAGAKTPAQDFITQQKRYPRVCQAFEEKKEKIAGILAGTGVMMSDINIMLIAYKAVKILEVWAKPASSIKTVSNAEKQTLRPKTARLQRLKPKTPVRK